MLEDFNSPLTSMNRSSIQKVSKETVALNATLDQVDLIDLYRTFHPNGAEYTFFSNTHGTFSRIDHMLGHKIRLNKFKIKVISTIFYDHSGMKLEINYKKKAEKDTNEWRLNNMLLNNYRVNKEIKGKN